MRGTPRRLLFGLTVASACAVALMNAPLKAQPSGYDRVKCESKDGREQYCRASLGFIALALTLHAQKHEVRLVEHRPSVLVHIHRELPTELIYEGNAADPRTLEFARIADAQVLVASMSSDAENLSLCFIAREHFKVPRTIATINDPRFAWLFGPRFHVDVAVNQADILAGIFEQELSVGDMMTLLKLRKGSYSLVSETLPGQAPAVGQLLRDLAFPRNAVVCAVLRRNDVVIPRGDVRFEAGDELLALVDEASAPELAALFGGGGR